MDHVEFFISSRRRHTRCALVTGVQTCALPIWRYQPGDRLPTHRVLAQQAGVAIGTVTKALDLLSARGILRGEVGRGTFVNDVRIAPVHDGTIDLSVNGPPQVIPEDMFRAAAERAMRASRSEEHTSELQSLMTY